MELHKFIFSILEGSWCFDRTIEGFGSVSGVSEFSLISPNVMIYCENGKLATMDGRSYQASRKYIYKLKKNISVYFADGNKEGTLFHEFEEVINTSLDSEFPIIAKGYHLCIQDEYKSEYRFTSESMFTLKYFVVGPKKNYVSETYFTRS